MRFPIEKIDSIQIDGPGGFGAVRKHDIHTGVDLYCENGEPVYAICEGVVSKVVPFTGPKIGFPWWNDTDAIIIETDAFVSGMYIGKILYGELDSLVKEGDSIKEGQLIGHIKTVLKKDKGRPMNMLHLEHYDAKFEGDWVAWELNCDKPKYLMDSTLILLNIYKNNIKR